MSLTTTVTVPRIKRPRHMRRFAHVTTILAWVVFCLNTAIFPCCQAFAGVFGDHSESISQPALHDHVSQDCDGDHPGQPNHSPYSPCSSFVSANPAAISQATFLATNHTSWKSIAPAAAVSLVPVALNFANSFTPREIPPPVRPVSYT